MYLYWSILEFKISTIQALISVLSFKIALK